MRAVTALLSLVCAVVQLLQCCKTQALVLADPVPDLDESVACSVDEIQLASDGTIDLQHLQLGARVTPNHTLNGTVSEDAYQFYHLCILRHEHEHQINVNLTVVMKSATASPRWSEDGGDSVPDANLYVSSEELHPRMGHATWIAQRPGSDFLKLFTYLDGFPRKSEARTRKTIPLHIGVFGVSRSNASFQLTVSVLDLPVSQDIIEREQFYTKQHERDHARFGSLVQQSQHRRLRCEG